MKITRLRRGYRIHLSDSEFEALMDLATRGQGEIEAMNEAEWAGLEPDIKRGLKTITGRGSWAVDDRRKA